MELKTRTYQKENNTKLTKLVKESLGDMYNSLFLAKQLAKRDIKAQYRQSYFGILWAFIAPLTTAFVWIFLNSTGTINLTDTGMPYPLFAFSGTLIWSIVIDSISSPTRNTKGSIVIMSKINFPKEALIISGIYKLVFNSIPKILLLLGFVFYFGVGFHWSMLLFPFAILGTIFIGSTIGILITPIKMFYNDISKVISMGLKLLMYITPIVYAIPKSGNLKTIMEYNPFTVIILTGRDLILGEIPQYGMYFLILLLAFIPLFLIALAFYRVSIPIFVERIGA